MQILHYLPEYHGFNPFFIRASIESFVEIKYRHKADPTFQSLLHQGIN